MKSSLKKMRGFVLHKHGSKEKRGFNSLAQLDELAQACEDMQDMRDCYDNLLSAAAATANCAYEFSVSLREMGECLLEKTALNDDEESGKVLLMLGKVQFQLQKLVDSYRSHISKTITTPSESLLNELRTVEVMKRQCDEKRAVYEYMLTAQKEKGRSRSSKGENFSSQQLQTARDEYDEEATLFIFRLKSLKQGQSRSLLTQAARHHAAQVNLFRKGLKSLEAVDQHVKLVTDQQHIDYQFSGLEDDDGEDGYDDEGYDANDDGELSFDYGNDDQDVSTARNSMELDQVDSSFPASTVESAQDNLDKIHGDLFNFNREPRPGSQSEPLFVEKRFDVGERIRQMQQPVSKKFYTYALPTPSSNKTTGLAGLSNPASRQRDVSISQILSNSSPLDPKGPEKDSRDERFLGAPNLKLQSLIKEINTNNPPVRLPPPLSDGFSQPQYDPRTADSKKIKRQAFSGPISSKPWSTKPGFSSSGPISSSEQPQFSGTLPRFTVLPSSSPKISPCPSPPMMSSPKISELHELPRPPVSSTSTRPSGFVGHSAPLFPRNQEVSVKMPSTTSYTASPLPVPPLTVSRSFSIPSNSQRAKALHMGRLSEDTGNTVRHEETDSPPLTPISLVGIKPASTPSQSGQAKG